MQGTSARVKHSAMFRTQFTRSNMLLFHFLASLISYVVFVSGANDGLTSVVLWDPYSLSINGERVFVFSGEFHYPRLPVPELWLDVFQKFKANGLNAVTLYFFWNYHSPSEGVYDFQTPPRDLQRLLDTAKKSGLYVIARPGPYVNGEFNGGGLALWGGDGSAGSLRTSDETYHQYWLPWMNNLNAILKRNQITEGGSVILEQVENELEETTHAANNTLVLYMEQIENAMRDAGIVVPFTSNEKGERSQSWSTDYENVGGAVGVYGLDSYPGGLSCTNINSGFNVLRNYYQWFQNYSSTQPSFLPEFEGGYFTSWGGSFYDSCLAEHDPAFADVYYKNNIGQRVSMMSLYMAYGGTNWGNLAAPVCYTSYDYSAPLRETRQIQPKFSQTKLISLFTRVSQDLLGADMESNGTGNAVDSSDIWTWVLRNRRTSTGFYVTQHNTSSSRAVTNFAVNLQTSVGPITVPNVELNGRQSKIIVTDYHFGNHILLYSSADVLTYGLFGDNSVLVLYAEEGQVGEFAFRDQGRPKSTINLWGATSLNSSSTTLNGTSFTKYTYTQQKGATVVQLPDGILVYLLEVATAWTFFAPPTTSDPHVKSNEHLFVLGPYLVREVSVHGSIFSITGDNANHTTIEAFTGDPSIKHIMWNNRSLTTTRTPYGSLVAPLPGITYTNITLPALTNWLTANSLPEKSLSYNDTHWTTCNRTTTLSPVAPLSLPILYSSSYAYHAGAKLYRAHFPTSPLPSTINITAQNGLASGWSAFLNNHFIGGHPGNASLSATWAVLNLTASGALHTTANDSENILTILVDYTGHDETSTGHGILNARGLLGATLYAANDTALPASFVSSWKIQGNAGGTTANLDPVRGLLNEGGLYGERAGWHLPGFDAAASPSFAPGDPAVGLGASGVAWFVTTFDLDIDGGLDVPLGVELGAPGGTYASVQVWVNGWMYGKFLPHIGPQTRFPVPPGVVCQRGRNTVAVSLWAMTGEGARLSTVRLIQYGVYESGFGFDRDWAYLRPGWTEERLKYL